MPRTGRPKLPEAKGDRLVIRVTGQEFLKVKDYLNKNNITLAQLIRESLSDILSA